MLDLEQIVLRGRLVLGVLVTAPRDWRRLRDAVEETARGLDMSVDVDHGTGDNRARARRPLPRHGHRHAAHRRGDGGRRRPDRRLRGQHRPDRADGSLPRHRHRPARLRRRAGRALRTLLAAEAARQGLDIAVQPANLLRRGMRLIVMDVDSTLIQGEVIEMLAEHAGYEAEVAEVTERAMRGELDFEESLRSRVALLEGVPATALDEVYDEIVLAPGARTMVRTLAGSATASRSSPGASARSPTGWPPTSASTSRAPTSSRSSTAG